MTIQKSESAGYIKGVGTRALANADLPCLHITAGGKQRRWATKLSVHTLFAAGWLRIVHGTCSYCTEKSLEICPFGKVTR